jgi:uncharacterized tellurite resistance protein B-like protein
VLNTLTRFIERHLQTADDVSPQLNLHQKQLTIAALLVEVAMADSHLSSTEITSLSNSLINKFNLTPQEVDEIIALAEEKTNKATSLHQFTQLINQQCTVEEKFKLMLSLWEVAYADGNLDKYEDYVIRKIADLIYVPHSEFIRAKSIVKAATHNN